MRAYAYHANQGIILLTKLARIVLQYLDAYTVSMILYAFNANNPTSYHKMILTVINVRFLSAVAMLVLIILLVFHVRAIIS